MSTRAAITTEEAGDMLWYRLASKGSYQESGALTNHTWFLRDVGSLVVVAGMVGRRS